MEHFRQSLATVEWILRKEHDFCHYVATRDNWAGDLMPGIQQRQRELEELVSRANRLSELAQQMNI